MTTSVESTRKIAVPDSGIDITREFDVITETFEDDFSTILENAEDIRIFYGFLSNILSPITARFEGCASPFTEADAAALECQGLKIITLLRSIRDKADSICDSIHTFTEI